MKNILKFIAIVVIGAFVACSDKQSDSVNVKVDEVKSIDNLDVVKVTKSQFESSNMKLGKITQHEFSEVVKTNGEIGVPPENKASVSAYFGGYVKLLSLIEGQKVTKGQILFTLENPDYIEIQKDFLELDNNLAYLLSDFERQSELVKDSVVSEKTFLKAKSDYEIAVVKFEALKKKLKLMNINTATLSSANLSSIINVISPISGYVTDVNVSKGMFLSPSNIAVKIVNLDHIHIELNVYEQDLAKISIGQKVNFKLQNNSTIYSAKVHLINKIIDKESRLINIHCHLENEKETKLFTPGMYVEADILTKSKAGNSLPNDAIVNIEDSYYALTLVKQNQNDYVFEKVKLKIGRNQNGMTEILNANLIEKAPDFLINGAFNLINE